MNTVDYVKKAVDAAGSQSALAKAVGVSQPAVNKWLRGGGIGLEHALAIERITGGTVRAVQLHPALSEALQMTG